MNNDKKNTIIGGGYCQTEIIIDHSKNYLPTINDIQAMEENKKLINIMESHQQELVNLALQPGYNNSNKRMEILKLKNKKGRDKSDEKD